MSSYLGTELGALTILVMGHGKVMTTLSSKFVNVVDQARIFERI